MSNELTGIKGFGEGDPKPEKGAKSQALSKSIRRNDKKGLRDFDRGATTSFASHAAKTAMRKSDERYSAYEKERKARYKREGITE